MTPADLNIAIAERCGWKDISRKNGWLGVQGRNPSTMCFAAIPDYCADLNAVNEAEARLTEEDREEYAEHYADCVSAISTDANAGWIFISSPPLVRAVALALTWRLISPDDYEALLREGKV